MNNSEFLKNLNDVLNSGEFNSEIAKKFYDISNAAYEIDTNKKRDENVSGLKFVDDEELSLFNDDFNKIIDNIEINDDAIIQYQSLCDMNNTIINSINDIINNIILLDKKYNDEIVNENSNEVLNKLKNKINELYNKYTIIINVLNDKT